MDPQQISSDLDFDQKKSQMDLALGFQSLTTSTVSIPNMGLMVRKGQASLGKAGNCFPFCTLVLFCVSLLISLTKHIHM